MGITGEALQKYRALGATLRFWSNWSEVWSGSWFLKSLQAIPVSNEVWESLLYTLVLKERPMFQQQWQHLGACRQCRISVPTTDLSKQNLHVNKILRGGMCLFKFEKHCLGLPRQETQTLQHSSKSNFHIYPTHSHTSKRGESSLEQFR